MEISGNWRLRYQRYRFEGLKCIDCGHVSFPPRRICPVCGSENSRPMELKPEGEIYSHTVVRSPPEHFGLQAPYAVAMIRLTDGPLISAQLTDVDLDSIEIGMEVEMVTRKLKEYGKDGVIMYGYKFRPKVV